MYEIYLTKRALKDLEKIPRIEKEKIAILLQKISQDPNKFARKLSNARIGTYRSRIGSYRVIFDLDERKIIVLRIGHRKKIYRS